MSKCRFNCWKLSSLLAIFLVGACSKENLENRLEEQRLSFSKAWHPLDHVPQSSMSRATLAIYRQTLLARSKIMLKYESSVHSGSSNSLFYHYDANQENYDLLFNINNGSTHQLNHPLGPRLGYSSVGLPTGQNASIRFVLDNRELGTYSGRIPHRLEMKPNYGTPMPNSPHESNRPLSYTWQPDPFYKPRQLLMKLHFTNAFGISPPFQFYLIADDGYFNMEPILDTSSIDRLTVTFSRFEGDLIDSRLGFYFEFESTFEHQINLQ